MAYEAPVTDSNARTWATMAHVGGLAAYTAIPFAGVVAVLVIWLMKRDEHWFIEDQGRESLNFQISVGIYTVIALVLSLLLVGLPLLFVLPVFHVVCTILAIMSANQGRGYRYPLTIRLISGPVV